MSITPPGCQLKPGTWDPLPSTHSRNNSDAMIHFVLYDSTICNYIFMYIEKCMDIFENYISIFAKTKESSVERGREIF